MHSEKKSHLPRCRDFLRGEKRDSGKYCYRLHSCKCHRLAHPPSGLSSDALWNYFPSAVSEQENMVDKSSKVKQLWIWVSASLVSDFGPLVRCPLLLPRNRMTSSRPTLHSSCLVLAQEFDSGFYSHTALSVSGWLELTANLHEELEHQKEVRQGVCSPHFSWYSLAWLHHFAKQDCRRWVSPLEALSGS